MFHYITLDITVQALFFWTKWSKAIDKPTISRDHGGEFVPRDEARRSGQVSVKSMVVHISTCSFKQL